MDLSTVNRSYAWLMLGRAKYDASDLCHLGSPSDVIGVGSTFGVFPCSSKLKQYHELWEGGVSFPHLYWTTQLILCLVPEKNWKPQWSVEVSIGIGE